MKKLLSVILALALVLSMGITAFAADETEQPASSSGKQIVTDGTEAGKVKPTSFSLIKEYEVAGGDVAPNETITFAVNQTSGVAQVPLTVGSAVMTNTDTDKKAPFTLTFGEYTKVGKYVYTIKEILPETKTLGVTYDEGTVYVVVTITNAAANTADTTATADQLVATVTVHKVVKDATTNEPTTDNKIDPNPEKPEEGDSAFTNKYDLGKLTVTKTVSGNLASFTKPFTIHVTFTNDSGLNQGNQISYSVAGVEQTPFTVGADPVDVILKNGDSAVFKNIPAGIKYTVVEDTKHTTLETGKTLETSEEGYTATYTNESGTIAKESDITSTVTNTKNTTPDTGIFLDSLPYVMIVAVAAAAVAVMIIRKRREVEG